MSERPVSWGVIRYADHDEPAAFDGWYLYKEDALAVYRWWCDEYPTYTVALIRADDDTHIRFRKRVRQPAS